MSAFIVSKAHIDALVQAGLTSGYGSTLRWRHEGHERKLSPDTADVVGAMLWAENVRSVEHRYEHVAAGELPGTYVTEAPVEGVEPVELPEWIQSYQFARVRRLEPVEILKAIDCYEYQSCEHEEWDESEAHTFCNELRMVTIGRLPGYDEAKWEFAR